MTTQPRPRIGRNARVNASGGANDTPRGHIDGRCHSCLKRFKRKRRDQAFCCQRCRLLAWWADELTKAVAAGKADGLKAKLQTLRIEVVRVIDDRRVS
jgi:endogenous inhibitor of DNA gyrase (YacG/DUF329 family)